MERLAYRKHSIKTEALIFFLKILCNIFFIFIFLSFIQEMKIQEILRIGFFIRFIFIFLRVGVVIITWGIFVPFAIVSEIWKKREKKLLHCFYITIKECIELIVAQWDRMFECKTQRLWVRFHLSFCCC